MRALGARVEAVHDRADSSRQEYASHDDQRGSMSSRSRRLRRVAPVAAVVLTLLSIPVVFFIVPRPNDWRTYYSGIFTGKWDSSIFQPLTTLFVFALPLLLIDMLQEYRKDIFAIRKLPNGIRTVVYCLLFTFIVLAGATKTNEFVYFQF